MLFRYTRVFRRKPLPLVLAGCKKIIQSELFRNYRFMMVCAKHLYELVHEGCSYGTNEIKGFAGLSLLNFFSCIVLDVIFIGNSVFFIDISTKE